MLVLMSGIQESIRSPCSRKRGARRTFGICRPAAVIPAATCLFAPERALADSVIDAAIQPYFVLGGWIAALVFLGIGFFVLQKAIRNRRMATAAAQWPTTDGTVISTDVVKRVSKSENEFDYFVPQIRYEYETNGIRRRGDVIRIGLDDMGYLEEKKAREHIALYPVGATIPVRYDPQNPEHAVLETGQIGVNRKIFAGYILAGIGIAAIVFALWSANLPTR
jgi:hypothetical protein